MKIEIFRCLFVGVEKEILSLHCEDKDVRASRIRTGCSSRLAKRGLVHRMAYLPIPISAFLAVSGAFSDTGIGIETTLYKIPLNFSDDCLTIKDYF